MTVGPATDLWGEAQRRLADHAHLDAVVEVLPRRVPLPGRLHGVPLAVKEILPVAGSVTSAGSDIAIATAPAAADCAPVALFCAAGALPFARTRTHEHAWGITGRHPRNGGVVNPHDPSRVAGGSSGGSAALVAAGVVRFGLGTDTAGSIRIPAAFCGVVGVKPTWGRVDLTGVHPLAESFDSAGILTTSVADAALGLEVWGFDLGLSRAPRIAIGSDPSLPRLRRDLATVTSRAMGRLDAPEVALPPVASLRATFNALQAREVLALHRDRLGLWPARREEYGEDVAARLAIAETTGPPRQGDERDAWLAAWERYDVLALPVSASPPTSVTDPGWVTVDDVRVELRELVLPFTVPASLLGLPALSLPIGADDDGLPVGLQLIGRPDGEAALLAAAASLEAAL